MREPAVQEPERRATPPAARPATDETRTILRNVAGCYFLSGALGLIYQVLWLRKLLLVFGSTVHAVSTVLTVFFSGLALGSWLFGRLIDRRPSGSGLRWYAILEVGVGLYAFLTLPLFDWIRQLYIPAYQASGFSQAALVSASFACAALILLVPTTLMGGTFPVLSRFLIRSDRERGVTIANLYAINTVGAMAGTLAVYYAGLPVLGVSRTLICAGVTNLGIGLLCLVFARHLESLGFHAAAPAAARVGAPEASPQPAGSAQASGSSQPDPIVRWLFAAFALSGFSAMAYEVAWTRALSLVLGSSIYAFCIMLATFLGGIALGSLWMRRDVRAGRAGLVQFIQLEGLLGLYGLFSVWFLPQLPDWFLWAWPMTGGSFAGLSALQWALSVAAMLLPTLTMGMLFVLVSDFVTGTPGRLGRRLGTAYAVNTVGGIIGSFLSGFVLIPWLGLPWAIVAAAVVNLLAAGLIYVRAAHARSRPLRLGLAAACVAAAIGASAVGIVPSWRRQALTAGVYLFPELYQNRSVAQITAGTKLLYYRDSLNATVSVHQDENGLFLKVGGKTDASDGIDMGTQALSAHLPLLLHRDPKRVLVIGLGSGITLGHAGRYPVERLDCAEIDPAVIEAARLFAAHNFRIHDDPRVRIAPADGRNFLLASRETYDVIISEPSNPWMAGLGYLFTKEYYDLAKQRLAPGGVMCQWVQLYKIFPEDLKLLLRTFHAAFPSMSVWSSLPGDLLLVGSQDPLPLTYEWLAQRMAQPGIRETLALIQAERPELLLQLLVLGDREVEEVTADMPWLHEDDLPWLEFNAPKALYVAHTMTVNYEGLMRFQRPPSETVPGYPKDVEDAAFFHAMADLWESRQDWDKALQSARRAVERAPDAAGSWVRVGELAATLRRAWEAEEALSRAVELDPSNVAPHRLLAKLLDSQRRHEEARRHYRDAAMLRPPDERFAEELATYLLPRQEAALAAEYARSAVSQGGGDRLSAVMSYATALKQVQDWPAAEQVMRFGLEAFPEEAAWPLWLGEVSAAQGRDEEAVAWFRQALARVPTAAEAYFGLGRIAASRGQPREAARYLRRGLQYRPYEREMLQLLLQLQRTL